MLQMLAIVWCEDMLGSSQYLCCHIHQSQPVHAMLRNLEYTWDHQYFTCDCSCVKPIDIVFAGPACKMYDQDAPRYAGNAWLPHHDEGNGDNATITWVGILKVACLPSYVLIRFKWSLYASRSRALQLMWWEVLSKSTSTCAHLDLFFFLVS
jgi:hypothetical protein